MQPPLFSSSIDQIPFSHCAEILGGGNPYRALGGRSPIEINPKLKIRKGSNTWYRSSVPRIFLPFYNRPSSSSISQAIPTIVVIIADSIVIITAADHPFNLTANCIRLWYSTLLLLQFSYLKPKKPKKCSHFAA
ncbi:hypothetical protein BHE74_00029536 [Ensete ventricosum]|nr:hypothetical protein GW17_00050905 [Ensete ventricosum]RWW63286.1 hypothetical protein BHE74_00029536 [Ensete ventricosum]RZS15395.1 hypothetical protein BHM03_00047231 [Ensete ventricosum]